MPDFSNVQLFEWLINNGVAVAFLFVFMWGIGRQITHAVGYFTSKLDTLTENQATAVGKLTDAISANTTQAAQNNEALKIIMLFISRNMEQTVAHRQATEGSESINVPGPQISNMPEVSTPPHGGTTTATNPISSDTAQSTPN